MGTEAIEKAYSNLLIARSPSSAVIDMSHGTMIGSLELAVPEEAPQLSSVRRWSLLLIYSFAMFIDIWSYSSFFIFITPISEDLVIVTQQQSWIITSYQVTFASVLLFWGRVADLFSPKDVFIYGFGTLGLLNLVISFLPDKYSFFIFRALSGIAGASVIPAAYRLITLTFRGKQLQIALTLFGVAGAIANATGLIISGLIEFIPGGGQMAAWRWFFRIAAALVGPITLGAIWLIPSQTRASLKLPLREKWQRVDLPGSALMLIGLALLIISLTFGATYGWSSASFIAPLVLSIVLLPAFFVWEARIKESHAILPPSLWRVPNLACLTILGLFTYGYFSVNFLVFSDYYLIVRSESPIMTAVRLLPEGISSLVICLLLSAFPQFVSQPRWPIISGMTLGAASLLLWIFATDIAGTGYWKYIFPGMVIGTFGVDAAFTAISVGVVLAAPPDKAGTASAVLQVAFQTGSVVALAFQAGLLTIESGGISVWANVQASFWFEFGWAVLWIIGFALWYRPQR